MCVIYLKEALGSKSFIEYRIESLKRAKFVDFFKNKKSIQAFIFKALRAFPQNIPTWEYSVNSSVLLIVYATYKKSLNKKIVKRLQNKQEWFNRQKAF